VDLGEGKALSGRPGREAVVGISGMTLLQIIKEKINF
jgi:hypothetical protein